MQGEILTCSDCGAELEVLEIEPLTIDLRAMPFGPGDEERLLEILGRGETEVGSLAKEIRLLESEKGPTVKTTMVVDSRAAASLIGRLMRPANARSVQQGRSFWADLMDEQAFSDKLTITDDPFRDHHPRRTSFQLWWPRREMTEKWMTEIGRQTIFLSSIFLSTTSRRTSRAPLPSG